MRLLGFCLTLVGILLTMIIGAQWNVGDFYIFLNWPTIIFFLMILTGVIMCTSNTKTFTMAVNGVLSRRYKMTEVQREKALALFTLLEKSVKCSAALLAMIGFCLTLLKMDDLSSLGPNICIILLSVFYGALILLVFIYPAQYILQHQKEEEPARAVRIKEKAAVDKLLQLCFEKGLTSEDIINADEITLHRAPSNEKR